MDSTYFLCQENFTKTLLPPKQPVLNRKRGLVLMKRTALALALIASLLISLVSVANAPSSSSSTPSVPPAKEWDNLFGSGNVLPATEIVQTSDGGYVIVGNSGNYHSPSVAWLVKTDAAGNMQWNQTYNYLYFVVGLVQTSDGGYTIAGSGYTVEEKRAFGSSTPFGAMLIKTDSRGNVQWSRTYGNQSSAYDMVQTNDGGYALAGSVFIKTGSLGEVEWKKTYGELDINSIHSVIQTIDGGYAIAGSTTLGNTTDNELVNTQFWLEKLDSNGNVMWDQNYGAESKTKNNGDSLNRGILGVNEANSLVQTDYGGYVLAGNTYTNGAGDSDAWLVETDSTGKMVWNKTFGGYGSIILRNANGEPFVLSSNGTGSDFAKSLIKTSDGGLAFAGTTQLSIVSGFSIAWLVKLDSNGEMQWNTTYSDYNEGGRGSWGANSLVETSDGGFALAGFYEFGTTTNYYYLVKTEPALPPPTPTPTPSSPPSTGILSGENLALFASFAVAAVLIAIVAVAVFRRRKKQTLPASPT
jgi:hypothetical protein